MDNTKELGQTPVGKLLWKYFVPAIIGVLANTLYNLVDRIYIGRGVGALALSGLTVTFPIMIIAMAFGMLVGMGSASLVSIRLGERKQTPRPRRYSAMPSSCWWACPWRSPCWGFCCATTSCRCSAPGRIRWAMPGEYITIILLGNVFQGIGFGLNNLIRAEGHARTAMVTMILGALLNILLDPLFIFVFKMGVAGAAMATVISMAATSFWVLAHFTGKKSLLRLRAKNFRLERRIVRGILAIGMAPFAMQLAGSVIHALFNIQLIHYGSDLAVGAMGIINGAGDDGGLLRHRHQHGRPADHRLQLRGPAVPSGQEDPEDRASSPPPPSPRPDFWRCSCFPAAIIGLFNRSDPRLLDIGVRGMRILLAAFPRGGVPGGQLQFFPGHRQGQDSDVPEPCSAR